MHYIGMDCHISTLDFAVINEAGRLVKAHSVATSVNGFVKFVKTMPPPRTIYMEEGSLAAWALETCIQYGEKLVITDAKKNHWIGSSGQKDDSIDALKQIDYGNWVSKKFIYLPAILAIIFCGLSFLSLFFLIGTVIFLIPTVYFIYAYIQFSPKGANLQAKIRDLVLNQLLWNGEGKLLDIGCGNGALAIEAAKKYSKAQITGIDYWGGQWEYSKSSCEKNAQIAP